MEFEDVMKKRYAAKMYDGRKIDPALIGKIEDLIRLTPSAINVQPWKIKVISDDKAKAALAQYTKINVPQFTTCSHLLVICADTDLKGHAERYLAILKAVRVGVPPEREKAFTDFIMGWVNHMTPEQRLFEAQKHAYLAAATALYAAESLGIDSCPMTGFDAAGLARELKLPPNLVPTFLISLGYAADKPMPKIRFSKEEIFF